MVVTSDSKNSVIENGAVAINNDKIVAVGPTKKLEKNYATGEVIDAKGKIVMPGTIVCHCHMYNAIVEDGLALAMANRSEPPDVCLLSFEDFWWPYVEDQLTKKEIYVAALVASLELIKSGTTCVVDILEAPYSPPGALDREAEATKKVGIRGILSLETSDRIDEEHASLASKENLEFVKKWNKKDDIVKGKFCPHTTYTCSESLLRKIREQADKYGGGIQIHLNEGKDEGMLSLISYRKTPVKFYEDIGFLGPDVLAAQVVFPKDEDIQILKKHDVKIAHTPLIGYGIAPAVKMRKAGLKLGIGTDGLQTVFEAMSMIAAIHKGCNEDYRLMQEEEVFKMATRNGATAAGYGDMIGSIEPNKKADLIILDPKPYVPLTPYNATGQIVRSGTRLNVDTVFVNGKTVMKDKKLVTVDEEEVNRLSREVAASFWDKLLIDEKKLPHGTYRLMRKNI
jgi:cytosine/adenosine deaminase-related metal-dependent hydrolase